MKNQTKILFTSDLHIGLRIENVDQTPYIIEILMRVLNKAVELIEKGYEVTIILGGDVFDNNDPSEAQIGAFIGFLSEVKKHNIRLYVMVGNHEARANPERLSCLSFIKEASVGFPSVTLIEDITSIEFCDSVNGKCWFTFLPHVSKALIEKKKLNYTPQEYIDKKCEKILNKLQAKMVDHYVFSHLNVKGFHSGSEENLLKRSDVYLPECFTNPAVTVVRPTIIQAHIHSRQQKDNVHIVGSPIFCSANESGEKGFLEISIGKSIGDSSDMQYHPSFAPEFIELELNMIGCEEQFFKIPEVKELIKKIPKETVSIIKLDISINPENNTYNWKGIQEKLQNHFQKSIIKTIVPRIVIKRITRNSNQKISLPPDEAVRTFIKKNWSSDKDKAKAIYKKAKNYL